MKGTVMNKMIATAATAAFLSAGGASAQTIEVSKATVRQQTKGSDQYFTGSVAVDALFPADNGRHANGGHVTFQPGARTAWHIHPAGQTLIVTSGTGWIVQWDGERREIKTGDVVWIPPNVKHWHGASSEASMSHIALQESVNGKNVDWLEQVSEDQYKK
jgi:quercetin dioxygenase-like cupin family protein